MLGGGAAAGGAWLLAGCGARVRLDALGSLGEALVRGVETGDRLRLDDGRAVRLAGVEAPDGEAGYAGEARGELDRLARGRRVRLLSDGSAPGDDGTVRAHVRVVDGPWLQGALLLAGAARVRTRPDDRALAADMLAAEARARTRGRGLWALDAYRVLLPEELAPWARGLVLVEGRVRDAGEARRGGWIGFEGEGRDRASAEAPARSLPDFRSAGLDLAALRGRLVRVRGDAADLTVTVETPEAVERLRR